LPVVRMALETFHRLNMIEIDEQKYISIANWEKHQNIDGMDKVKEQTRIRVSEYRERQKLLLETQVSNVTSSVTGNVTVTHGNALDIEIELDKEKELKDIVGKPDDIPFQTIIDYLNMRTGSRYRNIDKTKRAIAARWKEGFTLDDFQIVIDKKAAEWTGTEYEKFLRPETLFGTKFEGYLNQNIVVKKNSYDLANEKLLRSIQEDEDDEKGTEIAFSNHQPNIFELPWGQ